MATAVQIELMVDEKGAVSGVRAFDSAVKGSVGSVNTLDATLQKLNTHLDQIGQKGKSGLEHVSSGAHKAKEQLHLVTEELDIKLPRAFRGIVAESKIAQTALSAISTGIVGLGAIQIGTMVFSQLYEEANKIYEKFLDVDGAIKKFNDDAAVAASKKFYENAGIDQLNEDLKKASQQLDQLNTKKANSITWWQQALVGGAGTAAAYNPSLTGLDKSYFSTGDAAKKNASQGTIDQDELSIAEKKHQRILKAIEDTKLLSSAKAQGIAKDRIALEAENAIADEDRKYRVSVQTKLAKISERAEKKPGDTGYVPFPDKDTYKTETDDTKQRASVQFQARQYEVNREREQELRRLREEALESGLRGSALYAAQEAAAIESLKEKHIYSAQAVEAIHQKYYNEEVKRNNEQMLETEKIQRTAAMSGLSGIAKTRAEGAGRIADINSNPNLNDDNRAHRIAAASRQTDAEVAREERALADAIKQISDESATYQISGFARINSEASKKLDELQRKIKAVYGENPSGAGANLLQQGTAAIEKSAKDQRVELANKNAQETLQIEEQARIRSLSAEKQKTAAIQAEYDARLQKYQEELTKQEISADDYNRRVAAAAEERDAEMVAEAKAAREKMAGEFNSFFKSMDHPLQALATLGDKVAGQAAASLVQRIQQHGKGTSSTSSTSEGSAFGLFGNVFGMKKTKLPGIGADAKAEMPGTNSTHNTVDGIFSVSQATIHVGSAIFSGSMGGGSAVTTSGQAWSAPAGGTNLLTPSGITSGVGGGTTSTSASSDFSLNSSTGAVSGSLAAIGGAGSGSTAAAVPSFSTGSAGTAPTKKNLLGGALSEVKQGFGLFKQAKSTFGSGEGSSSTFSSGSNDLATVQHPSIDGQYDENGNFMSSASGATSSSSSTANMTNGASKTTRAMSAASGVLGVYSAYEGNGGVGGGLSGAMSGMQLGMSLGGPMGAAIGAIGGAIIGAIGFGGREKARVYDLKTVRPRLANDRDSYQQGSMDYLSAYADAQSLQTEAAKTTDQMGPAARSYYQDTIKPEIKQAEGKLTAEQRAGRSKYTVQAAQYDTGGIVDSFGDLATSPDHGLIHAQLGEFTVKPNVYQRNKSTLDALNAGASMDAVHANYRNAMQSNDAQRSSGGGDRTLNMNVHALDARGVAQFLDKYKHHIRAAVNDSHAENSGGGLA